jgi:hypothetical protein
VIVIRYQGLTGFSRTTKGHPWAGAYLKAYDPEAHDGQGFAEWTMDPAEALRFENAVDALEFWRQVPKSRPVRGDGQPNRPLTAYTIAVEKAPTSEGKAS